MNEVELLLKILLILGSGISLLLLIGNVMSDIYDSNNKLKATFRAISFILLISLCAITMMITILIL